MGIHILGTSHISPNSKEQVKREADSGKYEIIALELDHPRLQKLLSGDKKQPPFRLLVREVGFSGALLAKAGHYVEHKLGGKVGTEPGDEMLEGIKSAKEKKLKVALIDQPINKTLQRFNQEFRFKAKMRLIKNSFKFTKLKIDLKEVPDKETVTKLLVELDRISPELAKVLVHERNDYMAEKLIAIQKNHPTADILAVVGAGHVPGLSECLNRISKNKEDNEAKS